MGGHAPYRIPKKYRRMYLTDAQVDRSYDLRRSLYGCIVKATNERFNIEGRDFLLQDDRQILRRQYDAAIRYLDDRVGEVIGLFEQRGLLDNTVVVITADHGEYLDTHQMWSHCFLAYDDVIHVPLLVTEPGRRQEVRVTTPVQLSDIGPTVKQAAFGAEWDGQNFGSRNLIALANTPDAPGIVIAQYSGPNPKWVPRMRRRGDPVVDHRVEPQVAVTDGRFKYMTSGDGQRELYDLRDDPRELSNLIESHAAQADRLAAKLREWLNAVPQYQPSPPGDAPAMDAARVKALRSLGYVGD